MRKLKQRIISLLLAVSMVFGLVQVSPMQVEAASSGNLGLADGIIWLAKEGDGVSKEFSDMIEKQLKLDDMVREALGEPADTKVYFDGVNVGNAIELYLNQGKIESMVEEMKAAIRNKEHIVFHLGSADGEAKKIAFRSMEMSISVAGSDKIYIKNAGAPATANDLENMIADALNNAVVSVEHNGIVETTGFYTENKTGFKATAFAKEGGSSYGSLLRKWPTATVSPDSNIRKAGSVDVTIYAAEYSQNPSDSRFKKTQRFEVYMYDERITVNAAVKVGDTYVQDDELESLTKSYSTNQAPGKNEQPVSEYYKFVEWMTPGLNGHDYTAIMKAKIDNNKDGYHDDLVKPDEHDVVYYVGDALYHEEKVTEGDMPLGPSSNPQKDDSVDEENNTRTSYVFAGWNTKEDGSGVKWPAKVTGDVDYFATWNEVVTELPTDPEAPVEPVEPVFTVTGTLVIDGRAVAPQPLEAEKKKADTDGSGSEYLIVDPNWADALARDGHKFVGWYYKVAENTAGAEDINKDGKKEEVSFDFNNVWNTNNGYELKLYCEFLPTVEVYDPTTGETVEAPKGEATKLYSYTIKNADGTEEKLPDSLKVLDVADLAEPKHNKRVSTFKGWTVTQISETEYEVTPSYTHNLNTIRVSDNIYNFVSGGADEDGATYSIGDYTSVVSIDGVAYVDNGNNGKTHTYAVDSDTSVSITPFRNEKQEIGYYVTGLTAYYNNEPFKIPVTYDQDYNAVASGIYNVINGRVRSASGLSGVELIPQYAALKFKPVSGVTLPAGQNSYSAETVYNTVINHDASLSYDAEKVDVLYKAQEDSYTVSLNKLFELLEADGLGALKGMIGEQYNSLEIAAPENHDTWKSVENNSEEVTAQEAADSYLEFKYEEYRADSNIDILQFVGEVVEGLDEAVYNDTHHKFGYITPLQAGTTTTEDLRITYDSDAIYVSANVTATLVDSRTPITITGKDVNCEYGSPIVELIMNGLVCSNHVEEGEFVTYDADTDTARNFDGVGVGTYNVQIAFKGNNDFQPAMSNEFKLVVKPKTVNVIVEEMLPVMKGSNYASDAAAKVEKGTPIVQVVAGISLDELSYGLNTEGSVKDWTLGFEDENLMIDAWVKLPQSYIELLGNLEMVNLKEFGVDLPVKNIEEGKYYTVKDLEKAIEDSGYGNVEQIQQLKSILNEIPEQIKYRLGIDDLTYGIKVRFDALEKNVYPTESGFYVNYAATLSRFSYGGNQIDKNYKVSEDYGFIVISPMAPIPNRGGVQLYDDAPKDAKNVFVYEYDCKNKEVRDLEVALNGKKLDEATPFYYGLTTRLDATQAAPSMPGVYFAGYIYTTKVKNEDSGNEEVRRLGSDSAIIIIKQQEAELTITGGIFEHEENVDKIAEVKITDKNGDEIQGAATVVSGTVNVKDGTANVSANDFYGTINVDFPGTLQTKWDEYIDYKAPNEIVPSDLIKFLEDSRDTAVKAADTDLDEFEKLAMKDAVSDVLDKINSKQNAADVSSDNLVAKAERVREMLSSSVAYYNKLIEQLKPLENLDASLTFYDLETEADKLPYDKTGYYLYLGVITDPELTVDAAKGLVIIHSEDDYIMYDTHVPYDGEPHTIYKEDETKRSDVTVMVNGDEISFFLDGDMYSAMNDILKELPGVEVKVQDGSDALVSTVYEKAEDYADEVYNKLVEMIQESAVKKLEDANANLAGKLDELIIEAKEKLSSLTGRLSDKLQEVDKISGDTRIILYNMENADDLKGMPVDVGTYEFYGYDYDVSATRGTLVIEPIYIQVEDAAEKVYGDEDPPVEKCVTFTYYSYQTDENGIANKKEITELPNNINIKTLIDFDNLGIDREPSENVGSYDMSIVGLMLRDKYESNYEVIDLTDDQQKDFVIKPMAIKVIASLTLDEIIVGEFTELTIEATDIKGNTVPEEYIAYTIKNEDGTEFIWDNAINTVGKYTITPVVREDIKNYIVSEVTTATLVVKPRISSGSFSKVEVALELVGEVHNYIRFQVNGFEGLRESVDSEGNVESIGLLVYYTRKGEGSDCTIENADLVIESGTYVDDWYYVRSQGIPAKNMGDDVWYKVYIETEDGYVYSPRYVTSPKRFSQKVVNGNYGDKFKALCVALMNYGSAAQKYFEEYNGYEYDELMNATFKNFQEYVKEYDESMITERIEWERDKFNITESSIFTNAQYALTLEGAITYEARITTNEPTIDKAGVLVWTEDMYTSDKISVNDAIKIYAEPKRISGGTFTVGYAGVAAKEIGDTFFMAAFVEKDDEIHYRRVARASVDNFALSVIDGNASKNYKSLAKALVVYGDYAVDYFSNR